jgi:hypothetical protein
VGPELMSTTFLFMVLKKYAFFSEQQDGEIHKEESSRLRKKCRIEQRSVFRYYRDGSTYSSIFYIMERELKAGAIPFYQSMLE